MARGRDARDRRTPGTGVMFPLVIRVVLSKLRGHLWVGKLGRNGPKARLQISAGASLCKKVVYNAPMQTPCRTTSAQCIVH